MNRRDGSQRGNVVDGSLMADLRNGPEVLRLGIKFGKVGIGMKVTEIGMIFNLHSGPIQSDAALGKSERTLPKITRDYLK